VAGEKLIVNKAFSRAGISDESQGGHGDLDGGSGGINGSDWKRNPQEQQFRGNYRGNIMNLFNYIYIYFHIYFAYIQYLIVS